MQFRIIQMRDRIERIQSKPIFGKHNFVERAIANAPIEFDDHCNERALFHALNLAKQQNDSLLLTARDNTSQLRIKIPDLYSRINALPQVAILPPDDELLHGVMLKLFFDRQISIDEATLNYILLRMPRSLQSARDIVAAIDRQALIEIAEITRPFVARILVDYTNADLFTDEN